MQAELDHIIWACPDLERGSRQFEALTGIAPRYGGMHASGATHNALVALGPRCYFEILAPLGAPRADEDAWTRLARSAIEPRILTYCVHSDSPLVDLAGVAARLGWPNATVSGNGRTTPAGIELRWQWLAPTAPSFGLAFPFFIDWLDSVHPAQSLREQAPRAQIALQSFAVGHPSPHLLAQALEKFGASLPTYASDEVGFELILDTPKGVISLSAA